MSNTVEYAEAKSLRMATVTDPAELADLDLEPSSGNLMVLALDNGSAHSYVVYGTPEELFDTLLEAIDAVAQAVLRDVGQDLISPKITIQKLMRGSIPHIRVAMEGSHATMSFQMLTDYDKAKLVSYVKCVRLMGRILI